MRTSSYPWIGTDEIGICYNLRLSSGYNSGKDLSREVGMSQLVKHKNIELYLKLYISIDNKANILLICVE